MFKHYWCYTKLLCQFAFGLSPMTRNKSTWSDQWSRLNALSHWQYAEEAWTDSLDLPYGSTLAGNQNAGRDASWTATQSHSHQHIWFYISQPISSKRTGLTVITENSSLHSTLSSWIFMKPRSMQQQATLQALHSQGSPLYVNRWLCSRCSSLFACSTGNVCNPYNHLYIIKSWRNSTDFDVYIKM